MSRAIEGMGMIAYILCRLQKKMRLSAIRNSKVHKTAAIEGGSQIVDSTMGRHSFCGYDCVLLNVDIGSFCSIADNVYVGGSAHPMHFVSTSPVFLSHRDSVKAKFSKHDYHHMPRTRIGNDVWIGYGARIKAGISVGNGAVVGMGAVLTRDVAPYTVVGGNPAREIKSRFPEEIVKALLASEWWTYSDEQLREAAVDFKDPEKFIKRLELQ